MEKRKNFDPYFALYTKMNLNLNVKSKTINFLEEDIRENFCDFELAKTFLYTTLKA